MTDDNLQALERIREDMRRRFRVRPRFWAINPGVGLFWWVQRRPEWGIRLGRETSTVALGGLVLNFRYVKKRAGVTTIVGLVDVQEDAE